MNKETLISFAPVIARAIMQGFAGSEAMDADALSKATGAVVFILSIAWSVWEKKRIKTAA